MFEREGPPGARAVRRVGLKHPKKVSNYSVKMKLKIVRCGFSQQSLDVGDQKVRVVFGAPSLVGNSISVREELGEIPLD